MDVAVLPLPSMRTRVHVLVRGAVQGVGFRPFVYGHATALGLAGWVANSADGLIVEVEGTIDGVAALLATIRGHPPPNASITSIETHEVAVCGEGAFAIRTSAAGDACTTQVLPDLATCEACLAELFDPADRRHLYPFINCTHCGPRYSIIEGVPYDRVRTSMRHFAMCTACRTEYEEPSDRRFHAEPIACPTCGPRVALWDRAGHAVQDGHEALLEAARAIRGGQIVALKGIGGFQLLANACDEAAVRTLRVRKRREEKPFALMFPSLREVRASCRVSPLEEALLCGRERPIVLLARSGGPLADSVAPGLPTLGAMLPYSPLHYLLMRELAFPIVATSGNLAEEPIVTDEMRALERLGGIADLFLVHDRPIVRPVDDSVARVVCGRELLLRRARGYAPMPIDIAGMPRGILAVGGHLKATVALTGERGVNLSSHIGDQGTVEARNAHARAITDLTQLHAVQPRVVARDAHPDYATTRAAEALHLPVLPVQHHVAHVAACMAEHGIEPPVLGVAWDGTGYGPDGTIWGGEFLLLQESGWQRVAYLRPFRLPGGESAVREPRRSALGVLFEAFGESAFERADLPPVSAFTPSERSVLRSMLLRGVNAPLASSVGRLFDAFAALSGLCQCASYEGQAAMRLEWAASERDTGRRYRLCIREAKGVQQGSTVAATAMRTMPSLIVDWRPALDAVLSDVASGVEAGAMAESLHNGLAAAVAEVACRVGQHRVVLTGGCFQNARLTQATVTALQGAGLDAFWHRRVPPNDGGIALGQAVWAARMLQCGEGQCV
jgi:hydrogenase maturation protein HypF